MAGEYSGGEFDGLIGQRSTVLTDKHDGPRNRVEPCKGGRFPAADAACDGHTTGSQGS
jgi:hypothetical protein